MSDEKQNNDDFSCYPFPRHLKVDVRVGHYQVIGDGGQEEVVEAENAKDALTKTKLQNIEKLTYMGFYHGSIISSKLLSQDEVKSAQVDIQPQQEEQTEKQEGENKDDTNAA